MTLKSVFYCTTVLAAFAATPAAAIQFSVDALANSSTGGVGITRSQLRRVRASRSMSTLTICGALARLRAGRTRGV